MSNINDARTVKNIMDALNTLIMECVQLNSSVSNAYCVLLSNEQMNMESYAASFGRNVSSKVYGFKSILMFRKFNNYVRGLY